MRKSSWATTTTLKSSGTEVLKGVRGRERKGDGGRCRRRRMEREEEERKEEEPGTSPMVCRGTPDDWRHIIFVSDHRSRQRSTSSVPTGCVMGRLSKAVFACAEHDLLCLVLPCLALSCMFVLVVSLLSKFALPYLTVFFF